MTCQTCLNWSPKQSGQMARYGLAICLKGKRWTYLPPQHTCNQHKAAAEDVVNARVVWLNKTKG